MTHTSQNKSSGEQSAISFSIFAIAPYNITADTRQHQLARFFYIFILKITSFSCIILYITGQALCGNVRHIFISDRQETPYFDHLTDLFAFRLIRKQVSKQGWLRNQFPNQAGSKSVRQMASEDTDFAGITRHLTRSAKVPPTGTEPGPVRMPNGHATS